MKREERRAREARQAVVVLAQQQAKRFVVAHIRAQGWKVYDFTSADLTRWAEVWLREHPEIFAWARVTAKELGYEMEIAQCPTTSLNSPSTASLPSSRS
jgi:hypothetical protein